LNPITLQGGDVYGRKDRAGVQKAVLPCHSQGADEAGNGNQAIGAFVIVEDDVIEVETNNGGW
jgi:hypothetical protein